MVEVELAKAIVEYKKKLGRLQKQQAHYSNSGTQAGAWLLLEGKIQLLREIIFDLQTIGGQHGKETQMGTDSQQ